MIEKPELIMNYCDREFNEIIDYFTSNESGNGLLQLGSYSCPNYFEKLIDTSLLSYGIYDLVIPVFPENMLDILYSEKFLRYCTKSRCLVVNDIGMLGFFKSSGFSRIRLGRLFFRDYKDHRYEEYHNMEYEVKSLEIIDLLKNEGYCFEAIEIDLPTRNFQITKDVPVYIHYPYRQISMSHICEFASIGKRIKHKFKPDDTCNMQCIKQHIEYAGIGYYKIGRNIYDMITDFDLTSEKFINYSKIISPGW